MRRRGVLAVMVLALMVTAVPAGAVIHEITASYCSGGGVGVIDGAGFLEPPPIADPGPDNTPGTADDPITFARPVIVNGTFVDDAGAETFPFIGAGKAAKWAEGDFAFTLTAASSDHPSAENCAKLP